MIFDNLLACLIFLLVFILLSFCFKVVFDTEIVKKLSKNKLSLLKESLVNENNKQVKNIQTDLLIDDINKILFNRILKITEEILLLQKLIFNKES